MARTFTTVNYEESLKQTVTISDCLPPEHLARFIVGIISILDVRAIYAGYAPVGGAAIAPELLLGILFYGYATGVFSSRKLERATYESIPFRFIAGGLHPDHATIAAFRKTFLPEFTGLFVQVLVVAHELGYLTLGNISLDGSKLRADASKHHAVSHGRLLELEQRLRAEVEELLALGAQADQEPLPEGLDVAHEVALREARLVNLTEAQAVLTARAAERYAAEQAEYEAKLRAREAKAQESGHKPRGRAPEPPVPGPRAKDQYNFTDPESRIMKNPTNDGFDQSYNAQVAVDQDSRLIVGHSLSNHPNDKAEALPTVDAIPAEIGKPKAAALDNGYYSPATVEGLAARDVEPYVATGREPHHQSWQERFAAQPDPPAADAPLIEQMAYKLRTEIGKLIYGLRKSTVEPVIGIIKEALGFRQFSLRGLVAVASEWGLVCLAYNLKRLHTLTLS
ncbi:MAG: IS1182 family transposase [Kiritimatiellota bacterium]|nr:IS1182 family transposase [Kiritimatiellota bacterium]